MKKKGQIQNTESTAVMIIILGILIFGLIFYAKIKNEDIGEKKDLYEELNAIQIAQITYSLPEIQCSFAEVTDYGCIDLIKFSNLTSMIKESKNDDDNKELFYYYTHLFGNTNITLEEIKLTGDINKWNLYDNPKNNASKSIIRMPIIIYDASTNKNLFGILKIEKYQ